MLGRHPLNGRLRIDGHGLEPGFGQEPDARATTAVSGGSRFELDAVAQGLTMAFSAVILALVAAAITYTIAQVRRRWYAGELLALAAPESRP